MHYSGFFFESIADLLAYFFMYIKKCAVKYNAFDKNVDDKDAWL